MRFSRVCVPQRAGRRRAQGNLVQFALCRHLEQVPFALGGLPSTTLLRRHRRGAASTCWSLCMREGASEAERERERQRERTRARDITTHRSATVTTPAAAADFPVSAPPQFPPGRSVTRFPPRPSCRSWTATGWMTQDFGCSAAAHCSPTPRRRPRLIPMGGWVGGRGRVGVHVHQHMHA